MDAICINISSPKETPQLHKVTVENRAFVRDKNIRQTIHRPSSLQCAASRVLNTGTDVASA